MARIGDGRSRISRNRRGNAKDDGLYSPRTLVERLIPPGTALLTAFHISLRTLSWILVGIALALVVLVGRLSAGPVALDWLQPRIEQALTPEGFPVEVSAERVELRLNPEERALDLVGVNVRYRNSEARGSEHHAFLAFPEVEITLSAEAFLKRGVIAASEIVASAPSLSLTRGLDGVIVLYSEELEEGSGKADFGDFLHRFATLSGGDAHRLAFLKKIRITGGRLAYYDRARSTVLTARNADLTLTRRNGRSGEAGGIDAWLRAGLVQPSGQVPFQLTGHFDPDRERIAFDADVADLIPSELPELWPFDAERLPAGIDGLHLPVRASITGETDLTGALSPLEVEIHAGAGVVDLADHLEEPIEIESAGFSGSVSPDFTEIDIDELDLQSRGARLDATGSLVLREGERRILLDLDIANVRAEDLPAFWPPGFGAKPRAWVLANIPTGLVPEARARIDLDGADFDSQPLRAEAIDGAFAFDDLAVRYLEDMPSLEAADGSATFDARRMDFDVDSGVNAGVTLTGGEVTITGMGVPGDGSTRLQVTARVEGPIERALALLDHPPLDVAKKLAIPPASASGRFEADLDVRLPLHDDVTDEEALVLAEADLFDAALDSLPRLGDGARLDGGAFRLVLDETTATLQGEARINDVPLAIDIVDPRDEDSGQRRRIGLQGYLETAGLDLPAMVADSVDGALDFNATVTETENQFWIDLETDLGGLALTPPGLRWSKPAGVAGLLRASIAVPFDGPVEIKQFELKASDLETAGALMLSPANDALASLTLDRFRLGDTDTALRLERDVDGRLDLAIEAAALDVDALLGEGGDIDEAFELFRAIVRAERLKVRGLELTGVEADASHASAGWRSASLFGTLASGGKLAIELSPDDKGRQLEVRSEDAGALISALDLGQRLEGGNLVLAASLPETEDTASEGRLEIRDFLLQDAPLLARMLTLASLTGIGNLLGGEGIQVDHLILPFSMAGETLTLADGLMRGSQLGLTVKGSVDVETETLDLAGTIIPVYSLNRLIGQVPVIGRILTGTDGRGAFAATFGIDGPASDPEVYVNPLSILTPGLLRDLVGGLLSGTLEPPDAPESDD